jgi:hypothetical protein
VRAKQHLFGVTTEHGDRTEQQRAAEETLDVHGLAGAFAAKMAEGAQGVVTDYQGGPAPLGSNASVPPHATTELHALATQILVVSSGMDDDGCP